MGRSLPRPGWLLLGALVAAGAVAGGLTAVTVGRERAARQLVERLSGQVVTTNVAPAWLQKRVAAEWLRLFERIEQINLSYTRTSDADIPLLIDHLALLSDLRALYLAGTAVGDASAGSLARLTQLRALVLSGTPFTDEGLAQLAPLEKLEWLALASTGVTDRGVPQIAAFRRLEILDLDGTAVSDEGIRAIAPLSQLNELNVANTGVSESALRDLAAKMPSLLSVWDD